MQHEVTQVLLDASAGSQQAQQRLWALVYDELAAIAHRQLRRERAGHTLSTTGLVHELYLKLIDQTRVEWQNRAQFFAVAAQAMRRILISYARKRNAQKRGGGAAHLTLEEHLVSGEARQIEDVIAVSEALERLEAHNERLARMVECRYFGGLTEEETAEVLGVSVRTVRRDWVRAKGWLLHELSGPAA